MALINRDPFARTETHRAEICGEAGCSWCGGTNRRGNLFEYSTEHDAGRKGTHRGRFCSKSCHDSYHS